MSPPLWVRGSALLVDLDGTLVDSSASVERAWRRWVERRADVLVGDLDGVLAFQAGRVSEDTIRHFAPALGLDEVAADARTILDGQTADTADTVALPGVATVIGELVGLGVRWAVVTSADAALAGARLAAAALPAPPVLVTADDVGRPKPDPEGYLRAAAAVGVDPSGALVVEDSLAGTEAGLSAGCRVLVVGDTWHPGDRVLAFRWGDVVDVRGGPDDVVLHLR